jgi:hypothetical protein
MLINFRNAMMAGKRTPTAKDYVQSGLVAMWDGIENAGRGTHVASAQSWANLIPDGVAATTTNTVSFGNAWIEPFNAANILQLSAALEGTKQIEIVATIPQTDSGFAYFFNNGNTVKKRYFYLVRGRVVLFDVQSTSANSFNVSETAPVSISINYDDFSVLQNGQAVTGFLTYNDYFTSNNSLNIGGRRITSNPYPGKIYSIRAYNRALTADEIAANYAIDKARFNLP